MHDLAFADSARQAPVRILRLQMLPYSIGHEILLLNQRNPLLFDRTEFDSLPCSKQCSALKRAALVCYRTWNQNHKLERNLRFWNWTIRRANWPAEIAGWRNYREAGSTCPPAPTQEAYEIANGLQNEERGRELGGSPMARLLNFSCSVFEKLNCDTPYDVPLGLAGHLYFTSLEMAGRSMIENELEAHAREEMAGHRKAIEKEKKCLP